MEPHAVPASRVRARTVAWVLSAASTAAVVCAPRVASAQTSARDPRFDRAVAAFQAQDYETALRLFQQLYVDTRSPALLFNIGRAQELLHRPEEAARALRQYLLQVPNAPNRADVEAQIQQLEAAARAAPQPGTPQPGTPSGGNNPPASGGTAGTGNNNNNTPVTPPPASRPFWPLGVAGAGLLIGGIGAVTLALVPGQLQATQNATSEDQYESIVSTANTQQGVAWGLIGGGVAVMAAGVVLYLVSGSSHPDHPPHAEVGFTTVPGGGVATVTVHAF